MWEASKKTFPIFSLDQYFSLAVPRKAVFLTATFGNNILCRVLLFNDIMH